MKLKLSKAPLLETCALVAVFAFILLMDQAFAVSLAWQFCLGALVLAFCFVLPGLISRRDNQALGLFAAFGAALVALHFVALTPVKPFTRLYGDIENGMTKGQVGQLLVRHFPVSGKFRQPVATATRLAPFVPPGYGPRMADTPNESLQYTLDPDDGRYNAEFLMIYFKDDKVVGTGYLPD